MCTAAIFGSPELTRNAKSVKIADFSAGAWAFAKPQFRNDLEPVVGAKFPAVQAALVWLAHQDSAASISARMSGSGACVFAGFASHREAEAVFARRPAGPSSGLDAGLVGGLDGGLDGFVARSLARHPLAGFA